MPISIQMPWRLLLPVCVMLASRANPSFDQTKLWGNGQQAPLTPEYQAMLDAGIADQVKGGLGNSAEHVLCRGAGMPFMMIAYMLMVASADLRSKFLHCRTIARR